VLFWHLAGAIAIFRSVYRDPKIDLRLLALGAVLANLIDKPLALVSQLPPRSVGHTLVLPILLMITGLVATRRGRARRMWMAVVIALFLHLVLDFMWFDTETLLWPLFGSFSDYDGPVLGDLANPWAWLQELVGLGYLVFLARKAGLTDPRRRSELIRTGRIAT